MMKGDAATTERVDFSLTEVEGQDNYKVFMLGDMHLANRTGDLGQFMDFTEDLEHATVPCISTKRCMPLRWAT